MKGVRAKALDGFTDAEMLYWLRTDGPPFIFGSALPLAVGDQFFIGDQPFSVVRIATREEYLQRQIERGCQPASLEPCGFFFEAATD